MMVADLEHDTGVVLGQVVTDRKSNEISAVRDRPVILTSKVVQSTLDAMHAQQNTARCLIEYIFTAVKNNQKAVADDIRVFDFDAVPECTTSDHGHGQIEKRSFTSQGRIIHAKEV